MTDNEVYRNDDPSDIMEEIPSSDPGMSGDDSDDSSVMEKDGGSEDGAVNKRNFHLFTMIVGGICAFLIVLVIGLVIGFVTGLYGDFSGEYVKTYKSEYSFEETLDFIRVNFISKGWKVLNEIDFQEKLAKAKYDIRRHNVIVLCAPHHAYNLLKNPENSHFVAFMPCRVGVYETDEGDVMVSLGQMDMVATHFSQVVEDIADAVMDEMTEIVKKVEYDVV